MTNMAVWKAGANFTALFCKNTVFDYNQITFDGELMVKTLRLC
jgi:hypothetical protein